MILEYVLVAVEVAATNILSGSFGSLKRLMTGHSSHQIESTCISTLDLAAEGGR